MLDVAVTVTSVVTEPNNALAIVNESWYDVEGLRPLIMVDMELTVLLPMFWM